MSVVARGGAYVRGGGLGAGGGCVRDGGGEGFFFFNGVWEVSGRRLM